MIETVIELREASYIRRAHVLMATVLTACGCISAPAAAEQSSTLISDVRIGFDQSYKAGYWTPVWVEAAVPEPTADARIEVIVADSDGVATMVTAALSKEGAPSGRLTAIAYTRVGRVSGSIKVKLVNGDRVLEERTLQPGRTKPGDALVALSPTAELRVAFGKSAGDLLESLDQNSRSDSQPNRRLARLTNVAELPHDWFGYEAVNMLVISGADRQLLRELASDKVRFTALSRWVELGGRLVVLCGGEDAEEMLAENGPLASLAPGTLAEIVRPETGPIEHYARSEAPLSALSARAQIRVPRLVNILGNIELHAGQRATDYPLVVRAPRGLGEVALVALDFTQPPLADWEGRSAFLQTVLRPYTAATTVSDTGETLVSRGYNDLSGALRQGLGRSFAGVAPMTFPIVAVLAFAYILVLGPIDYLVVHRWLRRPWAAWVSFPLFAMLFGIGALALADWKSADHAPRVNRVELVDIDTTSGQMRGTLWSTLYSPRADQFDLALAGGSVAHQADEPQVLFTWWGLPGTGIGGMEGRDTNIGIQGEYQQGETLQGVPVLTSATKSLFARWTTSTKPMIDAQLRELDGLASGHIENRTGQSLRNVRLFYNGFAYRLGNLEPNQRVEVGEQSSPRNVKTVVTQDALGAAARGQVDTSLFVPELATVEEILNLMMFYEAAGGLGFAKLPNEYQSYCDLSRTLELGRAILVADAPTSGSRIVYRDTESPLGDSDDYSLLIYRFVLPVEQSEEQP